MLCCDDNLQYIDVVLELYLVFMQTCKRAGHAVGVAFDLGVEAGFGFVDEMAVVLPFDQAFE